MMDALTILEKYRNLTIKEYEIHKEIDELKEKLTHEKLLDKYKVRMDHYSFNLYYIGEDGKAYLIPLEDLKEIEELTNAKLTSMNNYNYHFAWINEITEE